jgi:hypothetical protein
MVVLIRDIMALWAKYFTYIYCNVITNSSDLHCTGINVMEDDR